MDALSVITLLTAHYGHVFSKEHYAMANQAMIDLTPSNEVVTNYLFADEQKDFLNWLDDMGYDDEQIDKFEELTTEQKIMFMEIEKLTGHVFYNVLVQSLK